MIVFNTDETERVLSIDRIGETGEEEGGEGGAESEPRSQGVLRQSRPLNNRGCPHKTLAGKRARAKQIEKLQPSP